MLRALHKGIKCCSRGEGQVAVGKEKGRESRDSRGDLPYFFKYDGGVGEKKKPEAEWGELSLVSLVMIGAAHYPSGGVG